MRLLVICDNLELNPLAPAWSSRNKFLFADMRLGKAIYNSARRRVLKLQI